MTQAQTVPQEFPTLGASLSAGRRLAIVVGIMLGMLLASLDQLMQAIPRAWRRRSLISSWSARFAMVIAFIVKLFLREVPLRTGHQTQPKRAGQLIQDAS